jgi:hypothetical protein
MKETIAVVGAGPNIGYATARRFGQEGSNVALIARDVDRLAAFVDELTEGQIEAAAFPADVTYDEGLADTPPSDGAVRNHRCARVQPRGRSEPARRVEHPACHAAGERLAPLRPQHPRRDHRSEFGAPGDARKAQGTLLLVFPVFRPGEVAELLWQLHRTGERNEAYAGDIETILAKAAQGQI